MKNEWYKYKIYQGLYSCESICNQCVRGVNSIMWYSRTDQVWDSYQPTSSTPHRLPCKQPSGYLLTLWTLASAQPLSTTLMCCGKPNWHKEHYSFEPGAHLISVQRQCNPLSYTQMCEAYISQRATATLSVNQPHRHTTSCRMRLARLCTHGKHEYKICPLGKH